MIFIQNKSLMAPPLKTQIFNYCCQLQAHSTLNYFTIQQLSQDTYQTTEYIEELVQSWVFIKQAIWKNGAQTNFQITSLYTFLAALSKR